jgi:hypothetical protein
VSESTLSLDWLDLQAEVGFFLGYGRTLADWNAAQDAEVAACVQSGVRQVYYPPGSDGYEWSFLRPASTLYLGASGTDGVLSSGTFDSATFTDWTAQGITTDDQVFITAPTASVGTYDISSVAAGAITLTTSPDDATSLTFRITRPTANYDLPDSFSRIRGNLHYAADEYRAAVEIVSVGSILDMRAHNNRDGTPAFAAICYKTSDGSDGQRQEILFWPKPDAYYVLTYIYEAYSGQLSDSNPYPLGGMHLSELYIESCLAVAEQRVNNEAGLHTQTYQALLADAIMRDKKRGARIFGQMGGGEDGDGQTFRRGSKQYNSAYDITYNGVQL